MPPYRSPEQGAYHFAIFTRLGRKIITSEPGDIKTTYEDLCSNDGIESDLQTAIKKDGLRVDADEGMYHVAGSDILLGGGSKRLPKTRVARVRSVEIFQRQSPLFNVSG